MERHEEILLQLDLAMRRNKEFEHFMNDFESQKVCYLPLNTFLLKPVQRLLHYKLVLESELLYCIKHATLFYRLSYALTIFLQCGTLQKICYLCNASIIIYIIARLEPFFVFLLSNVTKKF